MESSARKTFSKLTIYNALLGNIIPSLRGIILKWPQTSPKGTLYFYHNGEITDAIRKHYEFIYSIVISKIQRSICDYKIIRWDVPKKVPTDEEFIIYLRKEPFIDPIMDVSCN